MDNETNPNNPASDLEATSIDAPMHFMFEIQLLTTEIVGKSTEENRISAVWQIIKQHVRDYLIDYHEKHGVLPVGSLDLGKTKSPELEIGVVDFDAIRQKLRVDTEKWKRMNYESPGDIEAFPDYPMHREIELGMREQAMGRDANEAVFNLRQKLTRRLTKYSKP
jgi:hypothetical protein